MPETTVINSVREESWELVLKQLGRCSPSPCSVFKDRFSRNRPGQVSQTI